MKELKGFSKIDNNLLFNNDLSPYSKLTLTMLNYYTRNGRGKCFARKKTLSQMIGISLYKLRKALNELEQLELIHIERPGLGMPDEIRIKNLKPECSNSSHQPSSIIEEEVQIEEEKNISTENVEIITPKDDEPTPDKDLEPDSSQKPPDYTLQSTQAPSHSIFFTEASKRLTDGFRQVLRDASYKVFIKDKISVSYEDDENISINCTNSFICGYLSENYSGVARKITGKRVKFITRNGEYDGKENTERERDEEILKGSTRRNQ